MKPTSRRKVALLVCSSILLVALFASCAAAVDQAAKSRGEDVPAQSAPAGSGARGVAPAAPGAAQPAERAPGAPSSAPANQPGSVVPWDRMIIRTATVTLIVKDVEASIAAVRDIAGGVGGFVAQSNTRYEGENQVATITLQVPAAQFDAVVAAIRQQAVKVESENGSTQDVTEEYTDLEAQVRNLQATEASLQRLMDRATRIEDIITLQRELTNVRGEIERRQGRMKFLSRRSEMSTITVSLRPEALAKPTQPQPAWRPLEMARKAWEASVTILTAIATGLIAVVVFLWWLIPLAFLTVYLWRSRRAQRSAGTTT